MGLIPGLGRSPGEEHGNPLQHSWLENPMDRGAWRATVHKVTKSWTWLKWLICTHHCLDPAISAVIPGNTYWALTLHQVLYWDVYTPYWVSLVAQMVKNPPAVQETVDLGLIPESRKSPGEGNDNQLQYSCLDNSMDRGAWQFTQSRRLQRIRHEWVTNPFTFMFAHLITFSAYC